MSASKFTCLEMLFIEGNGFCVYFKETLTSANLDGFRVWGDYLIRINNFVTVLHLFCLFSIDKDTVVFYSMLLRALRAPEV